MKSFGGMVRRTLQVLPVTLLAGFLWSGCSYSGAETQLGIGVEVGSGTNEFSVLAGYGEWADISPYGQVWRPYVVDGWRPFTDGHWAWTSEGWTWVSYEPYGWLVYHYGDWDYDPDFGWYWIPGSVWSPARVRWITYGDYVGWAPIGPRGVIWGPPWQSSYFGIWTVIPLSDFDRDDVGRYRLAEPPFGREHFDHRSDFHAPRFNRVQRASNRPIPQFNLQREHVRMGNHDYSRVVLPPTEKQRVEENSPEFRRHEAQQGQLRPIPKNRQPNKQPPDLNSGRERTIRGRNNHTGHQNQSEKSNRSVNHDRQRNGEQNRQGQQYQGYGHETPPNLGQSRENPRYDGRARARRPERVYPGGRQQDRKAQAQHNSQDRHNDPHRAQQRRVHPKQTDKGQERNKLL